MKSSLLVLLFFLMFQSKSQATQCLGLFIKKQDYNPISSDILETKIRGVKYILRSNGDSTQKVVETAVHKAEIMGEVAGGRMVFTVKVYLKSGSKQTLISSISFKDEEIVPTVLWMKKGTLVIGLSNGNVASYGLSFNSVKHQSIFPLMSIEEHAGLGPEVQIVKFVDGLGSDIPGLFALHFNGNITQLVSKLD